MPAADVLAGQAHLGQHLGHELLAAEAGLDGHHEQRVELAQQLEVGLERGVRLDRQPGQRAGRADRAGGLHGVGRGLDVEGDVGGAGLGVVRRPAVGVVDHEVAVERQVGGRVQALHHRQPERQVGDEVRVHHVDVQPVGAVDRVGGVGQAREVGREDARRDHRLGPTGCGHVVESMAPLVGDDLGGSTRICVLRPRSSRDRRPVSRGRRRRTSRRCRAGAARAARSARRPGRATPGNAGRASTQLVAGDDVARLGRVRRAGHVGHDAAGPDEAQRRGEQLALQRGELGDVVGPPPPPGLGPAAQRPEPGARRVEQHPVVAAVDRGELAGVADADVDRPGRGDLADELGPVRAQLVGASASRRARPRARPAAPPCRPGPAHRSSQRSSRPVERRGREGERAQLAALVLHAGPPRRGPRPGRRGRRRSSAPRRASTGRVRRGHRRPAGRPAVRRG